MVDLEYPKILETIKDCLVPKRSESASFLVWYLANYYRLDELESVDSVCDQPGDKGIDGIYLNESESTIDIFQTKIFQNSGSSVGDTLLKEFYGTLSQFESKETIMSLIQSAGDADVVKLIERLKLLTKIDEFDIRGIFVTNVDIDKNGLDYLRHRPEIIFIGKRTLETTYISSSRKTVVEGSKEFDISGIPLSKYYVDSDTKAIIAPIKAPELILLNGIADQSIFAYNVRGPLGKTQVNRDIVKSIKDSTKHKQFPLFHNGITIIAEKINETEDKIKIENYYVVNGCQSLTALYNNRTFLSDDLRILTKFIQVSVTSDLSKIITWYSNNQNGVKARDFKSTNAIQIRLQNEFDEFYPTQFFYEIKRGEFSSGRKVISNELAGLNLMAFDLKEPWGTHRRYQVFEEKYTDLFARPEVNAHRILGLQILMERVQFHISGVENQLFAKYVLTRYILLYIIRLIFEEDTIGKEFLKNPQDFIQDSIKRERFVLAVDKVIDDIIIDVNAEVNDLPEGFDYRTNLRDTIWVTELSRKILTGYIKMVHRGRINSFTNDWDNAQISKIV